MKLSYIFLAGIISSLSSVAEEIEAKKEGIKKYMQARVFPELRKRHNKKMVRQALYVAGEVFRAYCNENLGECSLRNIELFVHFDWDDQDRQ